MDIQYTIPLHNLKYNNNTMTHALGRSDKRASPDGSANTPLPTHALIRVKVAATMEGFFVLPSTGAAPDADTEGVDVDDNAVVLRLRRMMQCSSVVVGSFLCP